MSIALNDIRAQLVALLGTLVHTPSNPSGVLRFAGDIRGEPNPERGDFEAEQLGLPSAALVQLESDKTNDRIEVKRLHGGVREQVTLSTWRVFVSVMDSRGATAEAAGSPGAPGLLDIVDAVRETITGFRPVATPAVLNVALTGTPNAVVVFGGATLARDGVVYAPNVSGVTLDGSGTATIAVTCSTIGALGNQTLATQLTWSAAVPNVDADARVVGVVTSGRSGLWRGETLRFVDHSHRGSRRGEVAVRMLRFSALHVVPRTTNPQPAPHGISLAGDVNLLGTTDDPQNPVDQIEATPEQ